MNSAVLASAGGGRPSGRSIPVLALLMAAGISGVFAQTGVAQGPPVSVSGWHYVGGPNDLHVYVCDRSDCVPGSRVFCHFDSNFVALPGIWWKWEAAVSALLGEPGKAFSPPSIDLSSGGSFKSATSSDGSKTYYELGHVNHSKWYASLTSASLDEKASRANLQQFEAALERLRN